MKNVIFVTLLSSAAALLHVLQGQTVHDNPSMLPSAVHVSGIVTDIDGKPLPDVRIDHTGLREQAMTSAEGRFEIRTRSPAIVFRKAGFRGKYYRVAQDAIIEMKLDPARQFNACRSFANCLSIKGFISTLCLPRIPRVGVTAQVNDSDYGQRWFLIQTSRGKKGIQHGAGPMWGSLPFDEDVWSAVEYDETDYRDVDGFLVIDARGKSSDGECWRVVGHAFEKASYRKVPVNEASLLDRVLDGACLRPWSWK